MSPAGNGRSTDRSPRVVDARAGIVGALESRTATADLDHHQHGYHDPDDPDLHHPNATGMPPADRH